MTVALDRHGKPFTNGLGTEEEKQRRRVSPGKQACLVFFPVCQQQAEQTRTAEPRGTHHTDCLCHQTWPTNLRTFPMPRMDNTSLHAASCSAAHPIKTPTVVSRFAPPLIHACPD